MIVCHHCGFNKLQPDMTYCPKCHQAINHFATDTMDEDLEFSEPTMQAPAVMPEPIEDDEPRFSLSAHQNRSDAAFTMPVTPTFSSKQGIQASQRQDPLFKAQATPQQQAIFPNHPTPSPLFSQPSPLIKQPSPVQATPHFIPVYTPQDLQMGELSPIKRTTPYHSPHLSIQQQILEQQQAFMQQQALLQRQAEGFQLPRQRGDVEFDQASVNFIPIAPPESFQRPIQPVMEPIYQNIQHDQMGLNEEGSAHQSYQSKREPAFKPQHSPALLDEFKTPEPHYVPKIISKAKPKKSHKTLILSFGILLLLSTTIFFAIQWYQGLRSQTDILLKACISDAKVQEIPLLQKSIESCELLVKSTQISDKDLKKAVLWLSQSLIWFYEAKKFESLSFESEKQAQVLLEHIKALLDEPILKENIPLDIELNAELLRINLYILRSKFALAEDAILEYQKDQALGELALMKLKLAYAKNEINETVSELIVQNLSAFKTPQQIYLACLISQRLDKKELTQHLLSLFQQKFPQHSLYQRLLALKTTAVQVSQNHDDKAMTHSKEGQGIKKMDDSKALQPQLPPVKSNKSIEKPVENTPINPISKELEIDMIPNTQEKQASNTTAIKLPSPLENRSKTTEQSYEPLSVEQTIVQAQKLLENGSTKKAEQLLNQAFKTNSRHPRIVTLLGWCAMSSHQYGLAEARFRSALDYKSNDEDALYGLANAYEKNLKKQAAITTYQQYLQAHGSHPRAIGIRRKLENLK
jgi:hypothetical protein